MNSSISEIFVVTDQYFFLKAPLLIRTKAKLLKRRKIETRARNAMMRISKHETHYFTNYLDADQNEMTTWIRLAIKECSKIKKRQQHHISKP